MRYLVLLGLLAIGVGTWILLRRDEPPIPQANAREEVRFEDRASSSGVRFQHFDPATPQHLIAETIGSGVAWIDYDADGWPDLFSVQDGPLPPAPIRPDLTSRLYRNNRNGTFTDVTQAVGLEAAGFGTGTAVGDYDNDGFDDLAVAFLGRIALYRNEPDSKAPGGRRFREIGTHSGLTNPHFATSCAWGDLDGDGRLDLFVCNYVEFDPANPVVCKHEGTGHFIACGPSIHKQTTSRLFRNVGNDRFEDVGESSGIAKAPAAASLAVAIADFDDDGLQDIYVANDMNPCYHFRNRGKMTFAECGLASGSALGPLGARMAGMGIAVGDFDGSNRPSLFVTNYLRQPNVLFLNRGPWRFDEASHSSGLAGPSLSKLGFGACALDADLDGNIDLAVANGHVHRQAEAVDLAPYAQESQLFLGDGSGKFRDASATAGADYRKPRVGRGLATADFDNDGLPDLAQSGTGVTLALFRNCTVSSHKWVSLELVGDGRSSNRNAIGASVAIEAGGTVRRHFAVGGGSYLSSSDRRLLIGLGAASRIDRATVRWPSGRTDTYVNLPARSHWRLREGVAAPESATPAAH